MTAPKVESKAVAFVDCCGYSAYTSTFGDLAAVDMYRRLRRTVERESSTAEVDVVKWMGDGVMLVADVPRPLLTCIYRIMLLAREAGLLTLRAGMANGRVVTVMQDGADYFGVCVNRAAKLCSAAGPWQLRAMTDAGGPIIHFTLRPADASASRRGTPSESAAAALYGLLATGS